MSDKKNAKLEQPNSSDLRAELGAINKHFLSGTESSASTSDHSEDPILEHVGLHEFGISEDDTLDEIQKKLSLDDLSETTKQLKILVSNMARSEIQEKSTTVDPFLAEHISSVIKNTMQTKTPGAVNRRLNIILVGLVLVFIINIVIIFATKQPVSIIGSTQTSNSSTMVNNAANSSTIKVQPGLKEITSFAGNNAIGDIGFQLNVQKNSISMLDTQNCRTPIIPPLVNGCGFAVIPQAAGVPTHGVIYKSLSVTAQMADNDRMQIDFKNYEKGEIRKPLGTFTGKDFKKSILLPENIPLTDAFYFRFWPVSGTNTITNITINYYYTDDLKEVELNLDPASKNLLKDSMLKDGMIYRDVDENGAFSSDIDTVWSCRSNFPGVQHVNFDTNNIAKLIRDDTCFTDTKPDSWYTDSKKLSLPQGKWLLVFITKDAHSTFPFEIKPQDDKAEVTLKLAQ